ncbi:hypothetical protein K9M48_03835 [Candidatus Gracilibacteria bacterium]|nr:hypothetical protein [Candidatus Gracilibacteria bacterium]
MSKFYEEIKSFYRSYDLKHSLISENIKTELFDCLLDEEKIIAKINEFDKMGNIKTPSFKISSSRRNIIIKNDIRESDILKYCRSRGHEIYFHSSDKFESKTRGEYDENKALWYDKRVKNNSVFFVSLAHEIGHCLGFKRVQDIFESRYYEENESLEFRKTPLFEEISAWYLALEMCRFFMDKGFDVLEQFENFDQFCDFMHLCILGYHLKKTPNGPLYLIDENKAWDILYG